MKTSTLKQITLLLALVLAACVVRAGDVSADIFGSGYDLFSPDSTAASDGKAGEPAPATPAAIPFDQIGAVAAKQYSGDGLVVVNGPDGVRLRCVFQRLEGEATSEGLWLTSTVTNLVGTRFRVTAAQLGRAGPATILPANGTVTVAGQTVRFSRPGLVEEYSVSMDGVRQDFVIEDRLAGAGPVRLELAVAGARAEALSVGARLVLADGGRKLAYTRLKAEDARGRELPARLEVVSANRLAVVLEDAAAEYPVCIDPTFSDANWSALGTGMNGPVLALAVSSNTLWLFWNSSGRFETANRCLSPCLRVKTKL